MSKELTPCNRRVATNTTLSKPKAANKEEQMLYLSGQKKKGAKKTMAVQSIYKSTCYTIYIYTQEV